jgi:hypothetical protein
MVFVGVVEELEGGEREDEGVVGLVGEVRAGQWRRKARGGRVRVEPPQSESELNRSVRVVSV